MCAFTGDIDRLDADDLLEVRRYALRRASAAVKPSAKEFWSSLATRCERMSEARKLIWAEAERTEKTSEMGPQTHFLPTS